MKALLLVALVACGNEDHTVKSRPAAPAAPRTLTLDEIEITVYGAGPKATFAATTAVEHETIAHLIPAMLEGSWSEPPPDPSAWQDEARRADFRIETWTVDGEKYWALLEGKPRGAGAYIFRVAPKDDKPVVLLEAPHNYYDMGTGRLAVELFFMQRTRRPRALFTNTIHRYQLAPGDKKKRKFNPADVAHNPEHAYTVATEAFAIAAGNVRVIQLHGFGARIDDDDDGDGDASNITMVVSAGDAAKSSDLSNAIYSYARKAFGENVKRFPEETKVLGATTNVQGRMLKKLGKGEFVHVEMSSDLRKELAGSATRRQELGTVLFDAEPTP